MTNYKRIRKVPMGDWGEEGQVIERLETIRKQGKQEDFITPRDK